MKTRGVSIRRVPPSGIGLGARVNDNAFDALHERIIRITSDSDSLSGLAVRRVSRLPERRDVTSEGLIKNLRCDPAESFAVSGIQIAGLNFAKESLLEEPRLSRVLVPDWSATGHVDSTRIALISQCANYAPSPHSSPICRWAY